MQECVDALPDGYPVAQSRRERAVFHGLSCQFTPRKYQREILHLVTSKSAGGAREFHIVAPPGSGKTILGLQLVVSHNRPALVLAPNAGIQSQWVEAQPPASRRRRWMPGDDTLPAV